MSRSTCFFARFFVPHNTWKNSRRFLTTVFSFIILLAGAVVAADYATMTDNGLRWPTDSSRLITSSFGEPRPDRFHAGMDISTNGSVGYPCYAIADGYVMRIKTDFRGYGKVLYIRLRDLDRIAVYAHLSGFSTEIEERVRHEQERIGYYEIELNFEPGELEVRQGDVVCYTGDTGTGPPHLHFELRDGIGTPVNPALEGFKVRDTRAPVIRRFSVRPFDGNSEVEGDMLPVIRSVQGGEAPAVSVYGRVGISAEIVDYQNGGWHRLGPHIVELYVNGEMRHHTEYSRFEYRFNKQARLDFDYELQKRGYRRFRRLYLLDGNELGYYDRSLPEGVIDTQVDGPGPIEVKVRAVDHMGNERIAKWTLNVLQDPLLPPAIGNGPPKLRDATAKVDESLGLDIRLLGKTARFEASGINGDIEAVYVRGEALERTVPMVKRSGGNWVGRADIPLSYRGLSTFMVEVQHTDGSWTYNLRTMRLAGFEAGQANRWSLPQEGFELRVGAGDLWFDLVASLETRDRGPETIARSFVLSPSDHPFQRTFTVAFHSGDAPWPDNAVIVYRDQSKGGRWTHLGHNREMNGFILKAEAYSFEAFSIMVDNHDPTITRANYSDGATVNSRRPYLEATVYDDLTGIDLRESGIEVDGKRVIWVYDPDANTISWRPFTNLERGQHVWKVIAVDGVGNRTEMERTFRVK